MKKQQSIVITNPQIAHQNIIKALKLDIQDRHSKHLAQMISELVAGFGFLKNRNDAVAIFGTARCGFQDQVYQEARKLAYELAKRGCTIVTGGGSGVMEAANKGAFEAGGKSIGLNIKLPLEQQVNRYVTDSSEFNYFFIRKVMLAASGRMYVFFPGGFGTLDELFEILTLIQTKKIKPIPIILVGKQYWQPLLKWFIEALYQGGRAISKQDLSLYQLVDNADEAIQLISAQL